MADKDELDGWGKDLLRHYFATLIRTASVDIDYCTVVTGLKREDLEMLLELPLHEVYRFLDMCEPKFYPRINFTSESPFDEYMRLLVTQRRG